MPCLVAQEHEHKRILFIGGNESGTPFHDHSNALSLVPHGSKPSVSIRILVCAYSCERWGVTSGESTL